MASGAEVLHETVPDNIAAKWTQGIGDVAKAFDGAAHVIGDTFRRQRYTGVPMEARGTLATQDPVNGSSPFGPRGSGRIPSVRSPPRCSV